MRNYVCHEKLKLFNTYVVCGSSSEVVSLVRSGLTCQICMVPYMKQIKFEVMYMYALLRLRGCILSVDADMQTLNSPNISKFHDL